MLQTVGKNGQKRGQELEALLCGQLDDSLFSIGLWPGPGLGSCWERRGGRGEGGGSLGLLWVWGRGEGCCSGLQLFTLIAINSCVQIDFVHLSPPLDHQALEGRSHIHSIQGLQGLVRCQLHSGCSIHIEKSMHGSLPTRLISGAPLFLSVGRAS